MPARHPHNTLGWYRFGERLLGLLPRRLSYAVGRGFGARDVLLRTAQRRIVEANVRALRPDLDARKRRALARRTIWNYCDVLCDTFYLLRVDPGRVEEHILRYEGLERFLALEPGKRGVIVATAHLGAWEVGGIAFARRGYPLAVVSAVDEDEAIEGFRIETRKRLGVETIKIGTDALSAVRAVDWLRRGGLLALLVDRALGGPAIETTFLGRRSRVPSGYASLALAAGAPILPSFVLREGAGKYRVVFEEPIRPPENAREGRAAAVEDLVRRTLEVAERYLRKHPDQYFSPSPILGEAGAGRAGALRTAPA
ncbi:MAG: lysophospholipid acyltransferase family protein [Planctomycetes bacterium]|nr:lysophospholipid acyltransferase family protein [Planctomycetota bacterium]